jgi:hypothetical protein
VIPAHVVGERDARPTSGGLLVALKRHHVRAVVKGLINVVDVHDVAAAHIAGATATSGSVLLALGCELPVSRYVALAAEVAGVNGPKTQLPVASGYPLAILDELAALVFPRRASLRVQDLDLIRLFEPLGTLHDEAYVKAALSRSLEWLEKSGALA